MSRRYQSAGATVLYRILCEYIITPSVQQS